MDIPAFRQGQLYKRSAIHDQYGGNKQSGISPSRKAPAVFAFTGESGQQYGYTDSWDFASVVFTYTGEGQLHDMTMDGGNAAIRDHVAEGRALHLFAIVPTKEVKRLGLNSSGKGYCRYIGEMQCAGVIEGTGPDKEARQRKIFQFQLVRVGALHEDHQPQPDESQGLDLPETGVDLAELRKKALQASKPEDRKSRNAQRTLYERARHVVEYALARANGECEACGLPAPFQRSGGKPYLEVHHIDRLSDGGVDAPHRVAAICPTCHRRIHCGEDGATLNDRLRLQIEATEFALSLPLPPSNDD